jgi:endonuclease YncB( thermonuclease family)
MSQDAPRNEIETAPSWHFAALLLAAALLLPACTRADLTGQATVIDGDTIEVHGQRIRLFGIDAPEAGQRCDLSGEPYRCGQTAAFVLADRIGRQTVTCAAKDRDRYDRIVAVCSVGDEDINAFMVLHGWALAYREFSDSYIDEEAQAKADRLGMWRGDFVPPWDWRRGDRLVKPAANDKEPGCRIKGNISGSGERIYHVPGGRDYDRTQINPAKGERWFCSEMEAQAAGWRRAHP